MATLVLGPPPPELSEFLARRRALDQDRFDEVWEGVYHGAPAANAWHGYAALRVARILAEAADAAGLVATDPFNLGEPDDYRVPDLGFHRGLPTETYVASAPIVVEVVSPDDRTYEKLGFYAARGVEEVLIIDPAHRCVRWFARRDDRFEEADASLLLGLDGATIAAQLRWPA